MNDRYGRPIKNYIHFNKCPTSKECSEGHKMNMVEYLETFKDEKCHKCKKKIGKVDVYRCEKDKETYHQGCVNKFGLLGSGG